MRFASCAGRRKPATWDAFDTDGNFLGTVQTPAMFTPTAVHGPEVTGVLRDEFEVEYVVTLHADPAEKASKLKSKLKSNCR